MNVLYPIYTVPKFWTKFSFKAQMLQNKKINYEFQNKIIKIKKLKLYD